MAALVTARQAPVDPDHRAVVHRAELEQHAAALPPVWYRERTPVPRPRMERRVANPAQAALEAVGHSDFTAEPALGACPVLREACVAVIELELPATVEAQPVGALELRLGKLGPRHGVLREKAWERQRGHQQWNHAD